MKKIALIACSNGYGHIRRLLLLAHALSNKGANPVLFAPLNAVESVVKSEGIIRPKIVDFDTHTNQESWLNGTATDWINFAPNFSGFDIVISDNLIEILLVNGIYPLVSIEMKCSIIFFGIPIFLDKIS